MNSLKAFQISRMKKKHENQSYRFNLCSNMRYNFFRDSSVVKISRFTRLFFFFFFPFVFLVFGFDCANSVDEVVAVVLSVALAIIVVSGTLLMVVVSMEIYRICVSASVELPIDLCIDSEFSLFSVTVSASPSKFRVIIASAPTNFVPSITPGSII